LISNAQNILDTLSHFRVTLAEEVQSKSDTVGLLQQIDTNIHDICDRIFLSFYRTTPTNLTIVLAASMRLRFPVPARFPLPNSARERLISRIGEIRTEAMMKGDLSDENLTLCYAYTLMAGQLAVSFEESASVMQGLFGTEIGEELEIEIR
jgi:hypothetical protein